MAARRPAHKLAHAQCPYGVFNWSDCDAASSHQWGRCKAEVERKGSDEPGDCVRWAQDDGGYCQQHFIARHDKETEAARKAARQLQLEDEFRAFEELQKRDPDYWLRPLRTSVESTRGLRGVTEIGPPVQHAPAARTPPLDWPVRTTALRPPDVMARRPHRLDSGRKGPHRLTELA